MKNYLHGLGSVRQARHDGCNSPPEDTPTLLVWQVNIYEILEGRW